jgi:hypothetical protein
LSKEQQHSQQQENFVVMFGAKLLRIFKPASPNFVFFSFFVRFICSSGISELFSGLLRVQRRIGAQPRCLVGT